MTMNKFREVGMWLEGATFPHKSEKNAFSGLD